MQLPGAGSAGPGEVEQLEQEEEMSEVSLRVRGKTNVGIMILLNLSNLSSGSRAVLMEITEL